MKGKKVRVTAFICSGPSACVGHPPFPTPGNFAIWELWNDIMDQTKTGLNGFEGFDFQAVKLITETMGHEFNRDLYDRLKVIEMKIIELNQES